MSAQEFRGTVSGAVTDSTGAKVLGAKVVLTETHTGTRIETVSDRSGQYVAPFLSPGDYDVSVKLQGFREFIRKGIHVGSGDHPQIDVKLEVGDVSQSVEVTDAAPLLNNENASVGQAITTKEVEGPAATRIICRARTITSTTSRRLRPARPRSR